MTGVVCRGSLAVVWFLSVKVKCTECPLLLTIIGNILNVLTRTILGKIVALLYFTKNIFSALLSKLVW